MLTSSDWFCGAGGGTAGWERVPGIKVMHAANHWPPAIATHVENFPEVDHFLGDIRSIDVAGLPPTDLFWASPECPNFSKARGKRADYADPDCLPGLGPVRDERAERSRALMEEVPLYLRAMDLRGRRTLAGVVENVVQVRDWAHWARWRAEFHSLGYRTRVIALNSAHVLAPSGARAPQSRDRLYVAYWDIRLGRDPDWSKWLRPRAWCPRCDRNVNAVQMFRRAGADMGAYRAQYDYVCPAGHGRIAPIVTPASALIDWTTPGQRIGDRDEPLKPATLARVRAGLAEYARPFTAEVAGNTFERTPGVRTWPVEWPVTTQTTTATKAVIAPPFIAELRGGGSTTRALSAPLSTATASGTHHGLVVPATGTTPVELMAAWGAHYAGTTSELDRITSRRKRSSSTPPPDAAAVEDCLFRMLDVPELAAAMAFDPAYRVLGTKTQRIRQVGNAVTPNVAEVLGHALVEAVTGTQFDPHPLAA